MKKGLAILLLAITLYNAGGYMAAFHFFIFQANKFNELQISKDRYKESDLVEVKIPVHLAGIDSWRGYERVSGSVQLEQNSYNYVRMKMTADTIYVMCIPNYKTTRLYKENIICAREVSEAPFNTKKQTTPVKSVNIAEHICPQPITIAAPPYEITSSSFNTVNHKAVARNRDVTAEPPESFLS